MCEIFDSLIIRFCMYVYRWNLFSHFHKKQKILNSELYFKNFKRFDIVTTKKKNNVHLFKLSIIKRKRFSCVH